MEQNEKLRALETLQKKLYAYNCASNSLYLDAVTVAPKNTAEGRGVALSILAGELQKLMTAPETLALVEELYARRETLDTLHRREVEELRRSCRQLTRIPAEEYMAYSELTNRASDVWHKAKEENDFASFCPILQELVEYNRKFAGYYDAEKAPYDALLNEYERGVDTQQLDVFFDTLRKGLVPLIRAIGEKPQIDDSFLHLEYPVEQQKAFADYLMEVMGLDRGHCGLGETEHPFTLEFNNKDVRITTNYDLHNVASSMYSVLHEGGHALYELGIRDDLQYTCLTGGVSMGVHESQSRFYENLIGRSRAFIGAIYPKVQEFFPAQLGNVTAEQFYRAVNKVEPSLIRTESDELTYCLHVMVRYEIEKQLIAGTLAAKEVPAAWQSCTGSIWAWRFPMTARAACRTATGRAVPSATSRLTLWAMPMVPRCSTIWSRNSMCTAAWPTGISPPSPAGCGKRCTSTATCWSLLKSSETPAAPLTHTTIWII